MLQQAVAFADLGADYLTASISTTPASSTASMRWLRGRLAKAAPSQQLRRCASPSRQLWGTPAMTKRPNAYPVGSAAYNIW
jgi:hypothetical protein